MKRILTLILTVFLCLLSGCAQEDTVYVPTGNGLTWEDDSPVSTTEGITEPTDQELVLVYYPDIPLNPYLCTDFTNRTFLSLIYQSLFVVDSNYNVSPILCSRYTMSDDMRSYTFYIEPATFSDGSVLTINDVFASIQAAKLSKYYKGRFNHVDKVELTEDGGIKFRLDTAYENFPMLLDIPIVKEAEVEANYPLGTGPYYFDQTYSGARLRLRNNWWCSTSVLPLRATSIPLTVAESTNQIRDSFEFSNVGLVRADPGSDAYVEYRCDYELWDCENGIFLYTVCNTEGPIFSHSAVRTALTHAIDRDAIVNEFYSGFAHSATLPASPLSPYYNNQLASRYQYDPEVFQEAVDNYSLVGAPLRILVNDADTLRLQIARAIGKQLAEYGFDVKMLEFTGNEYLYRLNILEFDLYVGQTMLSPNMDLSSFFREGGALRYGGTTDAGIYALCLETLANRGNYYNLHQRVMEDGRLCPLAFQVYSVHATRGLLTGLTPSRDNVFYYTIGKAMADIFE